MAKSKTQNAEIDVVNLKYGTATVWLVGTAPFFCNRMTAKAKRYLLLPPLQMTRPQKATRLKHAPYSEYRDSPYLRREAGETKLMMRADAPKKAIAAAALRMPTPVAKTEINQLVTSMGEYCPLYGRPRLDMSVVRMAGINRTPDIRTRARLDRWAMRVHLRWVEPMLSIMSVGKLVDAAGIVCGVGDWRIEKGGPNGGFRMAEPDDAELRDIMAEGNFLEQEEALRNPVCANSESEELLAWYLDELASRGLNVDDQVPEDIVVEPDEPYVFGANEEHMPAPGGLTQPLPLQNGEEV